MKIKDILGRAYNALEFVVVIATMIYIVAMRFGDVTHDRIEYLDRWEYAIIGLAWLFFIGLPIILIYLISLVRAIPLRNTRQKTMMALHVLNVGLWGIFYLTLPKSEPCTAAQMEAHYLSHHDEIHDLIAYTKGCLDDSTTIDYQAEGETIDRLMVCCPRGCWHDMMNNQSMKDLTLSSVGITPAQFDTINAKMRQAGVIGFEINRYGREHQSYVMFRRYGTTLYQYVIIHDPSQYIDTHGAPLDVQYGIPYNDSILFQSAGNLVCHRFPDLDQYLNKRQKAPDGL